ncbi:uncharacterized protein N7506_007415 [Penicillium brevicompactum]|uniref:uncharacterized protein n=1 Tax=Penicillium brevicompactum TaxID=5074 RepID=UPI002540283E|nr:uncharacterized protein N7506_007415 [Penicillium brevicompactum]KAJ5333632.1 hypothetical protein N7506_007415 [Penicillium brevicompactum]
MVSVFSVLTPDITSRLLGHFMDESPRWMSTRQGPKRAEYLEYLHPAISASPLVLNCILTIASADLLKYRRGDSELRHVALEYYGKAISSLRNEITNEMSVASSIDTPLTDYNLLAVLLLCLHETQNFTESERILPHLNAAVLLLQNRICRGSLHLDLRGYLYEVFCYFFSLTAFSLGHKLSLIRAYAIFDSPSFIGNIHHGHIMGSCQRLFTTIFRFSTLTQALASDDLQSQSAARFELLQMDEELQTCQVEPAAEQAPGFEHDDSTITYELYRLACRIHVKVLISSGTPNQDGAVQSLVEAFVAHLQTLPPNSPSHSILSWPLVIAGVSATESRHQRAIVNKLAHIYEGLQAEIFSKSAAFLRAKWKKDRDSKLVHSDIPPSAQLKVSGGPGITVLSFSLDRNWSTIRRGVLNVS